MRKKFLTVTLAIMMCVTPAASVYADRESDLREDQAWNTQQMNNMYARMDELYSQKQQLATEINSLDTDLVNVMVSIQTLNNDIETKKTDIKKIKSDLKKAKKQKEKQYEAMKKRIQYLYENGGTGAAWFQMMMNADDLSDMLNKAEYTQQMYEYDRENLEKYSNTVREVKKLKEQYQQEKADLEGMKQEQEAEQANLQAAIDSKRASSADCDNEIAYAQQMANDYAAIIAQQQAEIEQIVAEKIAAEEAARAEAERIAAEQAAAEAAENEQGYTEDDGNEENYGEDYNEDGDSSDYNGDYSGETSEAGEAGDSGYAGEDYGNSEESDDSGYAGSETTTDTASSTTTSSCSGGSSVVDYAKQFVGNPYVWGGTSLTSGADCSGFVQSVYNNFGVSLPRTSYEQQNAGREVSYSEAQPGDLICYGGHVAIYMGNGKIVHASNSRDGIKVSDNAAYRTILSVRRLV
ncbi:NlpC/P60 family protein [bacterium 210702-DFI.5.13]|nr:NlpC/P60 family protein [bacterium 210702-DFI.5.13]